MIIEIFVFVVFSNSAVQAVPMLILQPTTAEIPCDKKILWYKQIIWETLRLYNEYDSNLDQVTVNLENIQTLHEENMAFRNAVSEVINGPKDDSEKESDCYAAIDWYQAMNTNLAKIAVDIEQELADVLNSPEVPSRRKNLISYFFTRLVNFLSAVNLPTNQFKDLKTLEKQSQMDQEDRLLESAHKAEQGSYEVNPKFDEKEVDAVYQSVYENHPTHHPVHNLVNPTTNQPISDDTTTDAYKYPPRHDDTTYYSEDHTEDDISVDTTTNKYIYPPIHDDTIDISYKDLPATSIAVGCGLLAIILFAIVAVLCPCKRTPYNQF